METTVHPVPRMLASLLAAHGVHDVVLCPGTRNAPLIIALSRCLHFRLTSVVDERSAAFIALGIAVHTGRPVAVVCTSGSAVLNFAPALSEAYYRGVALIAVTADRPAAWIGQNDSQTFQQPDALRSVTVARADLADSNNGAYDAWWTNRRINDVLLRATDPRRPGPVHINVQLDKPLDKTDDFTDETPRVIRRILPAARLSTAEIDAIGAELATKKIAVCVGFHSPDNALGRALGRLAAQPNVVVFAEAQSNVHYTGPCITNPDTAIAMLGDTERNKFTPDVVITVGGSLLSANLKNWLRSGGNALQHWDLGMSADDTSVDVFCRLTRRYEVDPAPFFNALAGAIRRHAVPSTWRDDWQRISAAAQSLTDKFIADAPWCGLKAVAQLTQAVPAAWNMHISNGLCIRYAQLSSTRHIHDVECNRGISGIDGCTSTAIGAAICYSRPTLLLTGDMSAQYDLGALAAGCIPPQFRMAVLNNGGGDIFRFISSTRNIAECEERMAVGTLQNLSQSARAFGFDYIKADSCESMSQALRQFTADSERPVMLEILTDPQTDSSHLRNLYKTLKNGKI